MRITVVGDFADPLSYLASQRVAQIRSLGLLDIEWLAVEADRLRPMTGAGLSEAAAERVSRLALPGEAAPRAGLRVPNSRAATAAYAESFTEGVPDLMRVALFDALWVRGQNFADVDVLRSIVFGVLNPDRPVDSIERRLRANRPVVPLGDADLIATSRRLGFLVSSGRGPLSLAGSRRVEAMREFWQAHGGLPLPLVVAEDGVSADRTRGGEDALQWLGDRLPHGAPRAAEATAVPVGV